MILSKISQSTSYKSIGYAWQLLLFTRTKIIRGFSIRIAWQIWKPAKILEQEKTSTV